MCTPSGAGKRGPGWWKEQRLCWFTVCCLVNTWFPTWNNWIITRTCIWVVELTRRIIFNKSNVFIDDMKPRWYMNHQDYLPISIIMGLGDDQCSISVCVWTPVRWLQTCRTWLKYTLVAINAPRRTYWSRDPTRASGRITARGVTQTRSSSLDDQKSSVAGCPVLFPFRLRRH